MANINMQQIKFNYSLKNIGLTSKDVYTRSLINKTQSVIQRMRWKAHFFLNQANNDTEQDIAAHRSANTYGLKSKRSAPPVAELRAFEDDVARLIENVKFRDVNNEFMKELERDKKKIKSSTNIFVPADKTRNYYEMQPSDYTKLLTENVTKSYKHAQEHIATNIAEEFKDIVDELKLSNRTVPMAETTAFLTLKDHKPDFKNHTKYRLINPAKSDVGKISKSILDTVNSKIREQTGANQWRNSSDTIAWFQSIPLKNRKSFISCDIVDFYPSITESLLDQSIDWATQFTAITDSDIRIIKHARKSLLFHDGLPWVKRDSSHAFDVTMGSYDGAEICELVGLFILSKLKDTSGNNIGLYCDDGLVLLDTKSGRLSDKARKDLTHAFNELGLNITAQANQLSTNFLDITFDLSNGTYKPYRKPNDEPLYINRHSNHPPPIIRELPNSVNKRINSLSCNKEVFYNAAPLYNHALKHSNFDFHLHYESPPTHRNTSTRQNRQRNVIWFNPPYSKNVKTNIARDFLRLLDKHFPPTHKLYSIFNRHTVRISYSCTGNMKSFLDKHNKIILKKHTNRLNKDDEKLCNCRQRVNYPTDGKCLTRSVVYKAEVTSTDDNTTQTYIGLTANDFKTRYRNHLKSLRNEKYKHETELSKHVWNLKKENRQFSIRWAIVKQTPAGRKGKRNCALCLEEKLMIMKGRETLSSNS